MNHWSARRKRFIFLLVLFTLLVLVGLPAGFLFYEPPTCSDSKQNGDEEGIDCGGSCQLLCPAESLPLIAKGDPQVLEIAPGIYVVAAVVENPNPSAQASGARYAIKLFEPAGIVPVKVIEGETFVPKSSTFALFEGPVDLGEARPHRAVIEWRYDTFIWRRDESPKPNVSVRNTDLTGENTEPRVTALLVNNSLERVSNIELVATVSDERGNTVAAAKTVVESVERGGSAPVIFTWRKPFGEGNWSVSILHRIFPDASYIR